MSSAATPTLIVIAVQLGLGLAIFLANPRRRANQAFLVLSVVICGWLVSLSLAFSAKSVSLAEFSIRQANATGVLYLAALNLLRLSIRESRQSWGAILRQSRFWLISAVAVFILCQTKLLVQSAHLPPEGIFAPPMPVYGPAIKFYAIYFLGGIIFLMIATWRDLRKTGGAERAELAFLLLGGL